jgi:hypothetical protein
MDTLTIKMKKFALILLFILLASPAWATTFFLAPASGGGNDSNNGTSASAPWLTPNHAVNCGDVISAVPGTYSASNFNIGDWGPVSCPAGNNVAWLKCATFDACKISASGTQGMKITASFWGVQGWEAAGSGAFAGCFVVRPPSTSTTIHHIIFANDIANGCIDGGFSAFNNGNASVDYIVYVGNIAYNAAQASDSCASGFNIYQPVKSDSAAGTHMYVAGNFAWKNLNPNPCAGTAPTDGEGIILDTFDGSQGGLPAPYDQQAVVFNNITIANGGRGILILNNQSGSSHSHIFVYQNTSWGNDTDVNQNGGGSYGDIEASRSSNTSMTLNLSEATTATCCGGFALYAYMVNSGDATVSASNNWGYSAAGHNGGAQSSGGFSYGTSVLGTNPNFSNPIIPGAPNCGSASNVTSCMATLIANFTPTTAAAKAYGYQVPSTSRNSDPLFPQWLCNVNLPAGLVTMACSSSSSSLPAPPTNISATVR